MTSKTSSNSWEALSESLDRAPLKISGFGGFVLGILLSVIVFAGATGGFDRCKRLPGGVELLGRMTHEVIVCGFRW
jgi:hypothetical protein